LDRTDVYYQLLLGVEVSHEMAYSAMMASIIVVLGLPITVGAFFPSRAKTRGADIDPDPDFQRCSKYYEDDSPGQVVPPVGNTLSWFVRRKWISGLSLR
jgi:hypothetical protein